MKQLEQAWAASLQHVSTCFNVLQPHLNSVLDPSAASEQLSLFDGFNMFQPLPRKSELEIVKSRSLAAASFLLRFQSSVKHRVVLWRFHEIPEMSSDVDSSFLNRFHF